MSEFLEQARNRLIDEEKKVAAGGAVGVMKNAVRDTLISFCEQDEEFAQAVAQASGSFSDCMTKVAANHGKGISDIEAYRRAVTFYFPGADIHFDMRIDLCASAAGGEAQSGKKIVVRLEDFF